MVLLIYTIISLLLVLIVTFYEEYEDRRINKWLRENQREKRQFEHLNRRN